MNKPIAEYVVQGSHDILDPFYVVLRVSHEGITRTTRLQQVRSITQGLIICAKLKAISEGGNNYE